MLELNGFYNMDCMDGMQTTFFQHEREERNKQKHDRYAQMLMEG